MDDNIFEVSESGINGTETASVTVPADGIFWIKGNNVGNADLWGYVSGTENITVTEDLPITLQSFEVKVQDGVFPYLSFTTSSETNNDHFVIERSFDGEVFDVIDTVESKTKNGNSREKINYEYIDKTEGLHGTVYYRLAQVDKDGTKKTFKTKSVTIENKNMKPTLSPNPVKRGQSIKLEIYDKNQTQYSIVNKNGQSLASGKLEQDANILNTNNLPAGTYFIQIKGGKTVKFVVVD
jgi:hypothetical protein